MKNETDPLPVSQTGRWSDLHRRTYRTNRIQHARTGGPQPEAAIAVLRLAVVDELKDQVRRRVAAERLDWPAQRATFISDKGSQRTRAGL